MSLLALVAVGIGVDQRERDRGAAPVTIAFAGDMHTEGVLAERLARDPEGFVGPFAEVLGDADLAVGNLEAAVTERGRPEPGKLYTFRSPPRALGALQAGGFDVVSMANNHALDFGPEGFADTLAAKRERGDLVIGVGADEDEAYAPFSTEVRGQRIAVIAATDEIDAELLDTWTATPDHGGVASARRLDRLVAEVEAAQASHDTVVVYLHWGLQTETCPSRRQQELAEELSDAGADVIVGTHAHRLQGGGSLGGAFVHYGLGNFLFGAGSEESSRTGVLTVAVTDGEVMDHTWTPGHITDSVPEVLTGPDAARARSTWEDLRGCAGLTP
ncbi:MAG: CapA family protein [Iamia sp.]